MSIEFDRTMSLPSTSVSTGTRVEGQAAGKSPGSHGPAGGSTAQDKVSLTEAGARLLAMEQSLVNEPLVDNQRVENIKQALADGTYRIDTHRLAKSLLRHESQLFPKE